MVRKVNDALDALGRILECLLILYRYDVAERAMCVVFDYPDKDVGADRAFLRVRFDGVSNFRRIPGEFAELQKFIETYSTRATGAATVVQNVNVDASGRAMQIALWFGHSFGGISFMCDGVAAETRSARAIRTGADEWDYRDIDDGARVDFYDPFARSAAAGTL
ncbi:hypothetical protein [Sorangium cellulosum]|uniref:hypothetical protein n=1 Tax=Sorangium cellulosum TaxID=56 RepID=UPI0011DD21E4|nr:hypothetical protein [Sorangium cellulosum]